MAGTCGDHGMNSIHSFKRIYTNPTFLATCSQIKTPSSEPIDILPGETVCYLQKHDMRYKLSKSPRPPSENLEPRGGGEAIDVWDDFG